MLMIISFVDYIRKWLFIVLIKYQHNNLQISQIKIYTTKIKYIMFENKIDLFFIGEFNFFGFKTTSIQALFQSC
jgi:hypothetical protein